MVLERGGDRVTAEVRPVSDASWSIFKTSGFAVREIEPTTHHALLRATANAVLREYTGDQDAVDTAPLHSGLIVTSVLPDAAAEGMNIKVGDVVVGNRRLVREIHLQDHYVLDAFTTVKQLRDFVRDRATKDGAPLELWVVRDAKVIKARVLARK
jgi:hypothetical protein